MPEQSQDAASKSGKVGKELINKDGTVTDLIEWATQGDFTPEQVLDRFAEAGVPVSSGQELTGDYIVVHTGEKVEWCSKHVGTRLMVVQWHFYEGESGEFAAMHIISPAGKFIVNDSVQGGMYGQLKQVTKVREEKDPKAASKRTSTAGLMVAAGLRANKPFEYSKSKKRSIPRDELDNYELYPKSDRALSSPSWSFNF
jgi:hypothetical protein